MAAATYRFRPDYAVPPGWVLSERLEAEGISNAEFARRCGRSPKLISEIIAGKAPLEPKSALQFERVLGVDASIWLGIESSYRLHLARQAEAKAARSSIKWAKSFPVRELVRRGCFAKPASDTDTIDKLLSFFQVGSIEAWKSRHAIKSATYRHSPSFSSCETALATWRRVGEIEAEMQDCAEFNRGRFMIAVDRIRRLTRVSVDEALQQTTRLCNEAGVALALVQPLPKTALSGAVWWQTPERLSFS